MGTWQEIYNSAEKLANSVEIKKSYSSIASQASKSIYYFPDIVSKNVNSSTAVMMAGAFEAMNASFMSACFALTPAIVVKGDEINVEEYLKRFHQNYGIRADDWSLGINPLKEDFEEWTMFPNDSLNEYSSKYLDYHLINSKRAADKAVNKTVPDATSSPVRSMTVKSLDENDKETTSVSIPKFDVTEVEKKNSIKPSILKVTMVFLINGQKVETTIPVGIKTVMHPVDPAALRSHIMNSIANKGLFNSLIRYTTGEMMSLSDILFATSTMKANIRRDSEISKWVDSINHRKNLNKLSLGLLSRKPFLPNITVHISMDDVNEIERLIGYNLLRDTARAIKFVKDNFLLALAITDDVTSTAYILYDGHSEYEEYPYKAIRRENDKMEDQLATLAKAMIAAR